MFLHLGSNQVVDLASIVAIVPYESCNQDFLTLNKGKTVTVSGKPIQSVVISEANNATSLHLSHISSSTLLKRAKYL